MAQVVQTCYRHSDQRAGVVCQRCDRPICPQCMHQASVGFHCPECSKAGKQRVYTARSLATMGSTVTKALIALNVAVFVLGIIMTPKSLSIGFASGGLGRLQIDGGLHAFSIDQGEWWRVFTSGFLHEGLLHIGFNMYALWILGRVIERAAGTVNFLAIYVASLVAGSFGALLASDPRSLTVGASGAIFGLMGAALAAQKANGIRLADGGLLPWVALNLFFTIAVPGISIGGHIGGLIGGGLAGWLVFEGSRRVANKRLPTGAVLALGVACFIGALVVAHARVQSFTG